MGALRIPDLESRCEAAGLDLASFAGLAKLSATELALLARGDAVRVSDATSRRVAGLLGDTAGGDEGPVVERDESEAPAAPAGRGPTLSTAEEEGEVDPTPPFERALNGVVDGDPGRYSDEDRELLAAALHHAEIPSTVTAAQLPALAKEWLECARTFRGAREPVPGELLATMGREGGRVASLMARRTIERAAAVAAAAAAMANLGKSVG